MKSSFIDKVLERLDNLSSRQVEVVVDRLAREKGLLEQVLEALQEGVILFDSEGITMFINLAAEKMFGVTGQGCRHAAAHSGVCQWNQSVADEWGRQRTTRIFLRISG